MRIEHGDLPSPFDDLNLTDGPLSNTRMRNGGGGGRTIFPHRPDKHNQRDPWATPIVIVPGMPSMDELLPVDPKTGRPVEGLQTDFLGSLDASGTDTTKSSG